jgi:chorismate dehydratase
MPEKIRIGASRFITAWPLLEGLQDEADVALRLELPCDLGPLLRGGLLDAALLPSIEYYRLAADAGERARPRAGAPVAAGHFVVLPLAAIGSRGPFGAARLFGYADVERVRRVLLDPASRTAGAIVRLLLERSGPVQPHYVLPAEVGAKPARPPDAELVIGDAALGAERPKAAWEWDLGEEWDGLVHRPLVYAMWVARADGPIGRIAEVLTAARDRGLEMREALAARAAEERGIPPDVARRHLCHQARYAFGRKEAEGLGAFYRMAAEKLLAPEGVRLALLPMAAGEP